VGHTGKTKYVGDELRTSGKVRVGVQRKREKKMLKGQSQGKERVEIRAEKLGGLLIKGKGHIGIKKIGWEKNRGEKKRR